MVLECLREWEPSFVEESSDLGWRTDPSLPKGHRPKLALRAWCTRCSKNEDTRWGISGPFFFFSNLFSCFVLGHTWWFLELIPCSVLRDHSSPYLPLSLGEAWLGSVQLSLYTPDLSLSTCLGNRGSVSSLIIKDLSVGKLSGDFYTSAEIGAILGVCLHG